MSRLLITGARGFIGRHCLQPALEAGFEIHATTFSNQIDPELAALPVTWHVTDLLASGVASNLVQHIKPSHIIHAAWITSHGSYWTDLANLQWVSITSEMIHSFANSDGKRFVNVGTCAEYSWDYGYLSEAVTPETPSTLYGTSKLAVTNLLMATAHQSGFSAATGRIFFGYGPYENSNRIIPYTCQALAQGRNAEFSSGDQIRDFMHVSDIGQGFLALLTSEIQGSCNISSGIPITLGSIAKTIGAIANRTDLVRLGARDDRPDDPPMIVGNNHKLRATGWAPKVTLENGLAQAYEWWVQKHD